MTHNDDIEQLFRAHYGQLYRLAAAILHDDDLARDIVHDLFVQLLDGGVPAGVNAGYLMRAVRNRALNHIRDCELHRRLTDLYYLDNEEYDTDDWPDEEAVARMYSLIRSEIPPQARRVMELRFGDGLPFARIAAVMGISESIVYRHLGHALTIIRKRLKENG